MRMSCSRRSFGPGGNGWGYERTDPNWENKRLALLRREYESLEPYWRERYLKALPLADRKALLRKDEP